MKSNNCNALSPARQSLTRLPNSFEQGKELVGSVSVARVRPRTSKGITAISTSRLEMIPAAPWCLDLSGLITRAWLSQGISTYLKPTFKQSAHPFPRVATAKRYFGSPQDRPTCTRNSRSGVPCTRWCCLRHKFTRNLPSPDSRGLPQRRSRR